MVAAAAGGGWYFFLRDSGTSSGGDKGKIETVIRTQAEAFDNGNIERYMGTVHPESPVYDASRRQLETMFERFSPDVLTVDITIESIEMLSEEQAEAKVVQTTRIDSEGFRDNRLTQTFDMRPHQGEWLLYDSTVSETEYLE
ncbi:hypothetical protein SAMN05216226_10696 [Halovenus aranensis]|uniref:SnoaL-like domain-containing protein n=1 Tax=Halovenus aranensis TaxID=890420 RepID=A0A1G8VCU5_9EURY|nr:hypothetical protein [Halovenus aranensis]SDJ62960.1 hypothetical protein SAMN05216226_10696 [Halovenus aranensis]